MKQKEKEQKKKMQKDYFKVLKQQAKEDQERKVEVIRNSMKQDTVMAENIKNGPRLDCPGPDTSFAKELQQMKKEKIRDDLIKQVEEK